MGYGPEVSFHDGFYVDIKPIRNTLLSNDPKPGLDFQLVSEAFRRQTLYFLRYNAKFSD